MTAGTNPCAASTVQPRTDARGGHAAPRTFLQRLGAALGVATEAAARDARGVVAWAHGEIADASFSRLADDDDGFRIAVQCRSLRHPLLRPTTDARDELVRRIHAAWPELESDEVRRLMAHIDARVQAVLVVPSRRADQAELNRARKSWVHSWRFDAHDDEAAR